MALELVDTHVHLNFDTYAEDLDAVAANWRAAGVVQLVHSCVCPAEFPAMQAIADRFSELFLAVGLHPLDVGDKWTAESADQIQAMAAADRRVVAIGETGLDFYKADNPTDQEVAFRAQLAIARALDLPVIIHCRDAATEARRILSEYAPVRGVMHCWGGSAEETAWFVALGLYISFSGTVTFKNAVAIQESALVVPDDRLLVETDCPFLAPVPRRGRRNEPAYVSHVASRVAELRTIGMEELAALTTANARRLFQLPSVLNM